MSRPRTWVIAALLLLALAPLAFDGQGASAQSSTSSRLDAAKAEIARIQGEAETVEEQIASIDEQVAAVEEALAASEALVQETQIEIGLLERSIRNQERRFDRVQSEAENVAVELYKAGPTAELEILLEAGSIDELSSLMEYNGAAA